MQSDRRNTVRVYLDLTHLGRHVTGIERVSIEQFEKAHFEGADVVSVRSSGVWSMILKQQVLLPWLALTHPGSRFVFPGFPPSPVFALWRERTYLYVHDTFLMTRRADLSTKARYYMAPAFSLAVRTLKHFFVNSEKTRSDLLEFAAADAEIHLYRPAVANVFDLESASRLSGPRRTGPLRIVSLGTIEPRKNYPAAVALLAELRKRYDPLAELHIIGRAGWGEDGERIAKTPGVTVHGYLCTAGAKRVLEDADLYLCTSHDEGLGLPLLEAQFSGLAIVAPDKPVFREVLANSALSIDPAKPDTAAGQIIALLNTPDWRTRQAALSLANVERWNRLAETGRADALRTFAPAAVQAGHAPLASTHHP
jgi:glycosyltransferase involved in cell wall biosynthesis